MLAQPLALVERRLLPDETLPAAAKGFSLLEPHTEWIQQGQPRPNVEWGLRLLIAPDPHEVVQDDDGPVGGAEGDQRVPVADRLLGRDGAGAIASLSFDTGFPRAEDRELLSRSVPTVVMPKRGQENAAETARERKRKFAMPLPAGPGGASRQRHVARRLHRLLRPP